MWLRDHEASCRTAEHSALQEKLQTAARRRELNAQKQAVIQKKAEAEAAAAAAAKVIADAEAASQKLDQELRALEDGGEQTEDST